MDQSSATVHPRLNTVDTTVDTAVMMLSTRARNFCLQSPPSTLTIAPHCTLPARRIALALKLDEERLADLLSGGTAGAQDAQLLGRLLGCYGDLFSASLDVGWCTDPEDPEGLAQKAKCMLTVANNDVTRVSANVETLMFQSSVSPKLAVRWVTATSNRHYCTCAIILRSHTAPCRLWHYLILSANITCGLKAQCLIAAMCPAVCLPPRMLHAVAAGLTLRFYPKDSYQMRFWDKLFGQITEYLSKDALHAMLCLTAHADIVRPPAALSHGLPATVDMGPGAAKLKVVISGDSGSQPQGLAHVAPIFFVNDINLLTVLDSFKLLAEAS